MYEDWWVLRDRWGFGVIGGFRLGYFFRKHVKSIACFCLRGLS